VALHNPEEHRVRQIGIVECKTIGTGRARAVEFGRFPAVFSGLNSRTRAKADALARALSPSPPVLDLPDLVRASTLVVEAATREALAEIVPARIDSAWR
jgi:predicted dinucleotide-utilizing enzyme